jgi:hypothetical protein
MALEPGPAGAASLIFGLINEKRMRKRPVQCKDAKNKKAAKVLCFL